MNLKKTYLLAGLILLSGMVFAQSYGEGLYSADYYGGESTSSSSGSSTTSSSTGGTIDCDYNTSFNWNCSGWSECAGGLQTRTCAEKNNCGTDYGRPETERGCEIANTTGGEASGHTIKEIFSRDSKKFKFFEILLFLAIVIILSALASRNSKNHFWNNPLGNLKL